MRRPPLADLALRDLTQLVDLSRLAGDDALRDLDSARDDVLGYDSICDTESLDADNANPGVIFGTIVLAITEVAHPGLENGRVVLLDEGAVGDDGRGARDRGPLACAVEEAHVDVLVAVYFVGLVALGVGLREEKLAPARRWKGR